MSVFVIKICSLTHLAANCEASPNKDQPKQKKKLAFLFLNHLVSWFMFHKSLFRRTEASGWKIFNDKFIIARKYLDQKLGQGFLARFGATLTIEMITRLNQFRDNWLQSAKRVSLTTEIFRFRYLHSQDSPELAQIITRSPSWALLSPTDKPLDSMFSRLA